MTGPGPGHDPGHDPGTGTGHFYLKNIKISDPGPGPGTAQWARIKKNRRKLIFFFPQHFTKIQFVTQGKI